jgi:tetratricopeptide (TPR) repeat protein
LGLWTARNGPPQSPALAAGLIAMLVANQFLSFTMPTAMMFYVTVALLCSASPRPRISASFLLRLPISLLLLAAASLLTWSDIWLARTKVALESGELARAMRHYQRLRRWAPPGMDTDLWYSRALAAAAPQARSVPENFLAWQQAFDAAVRASGNSEQRPNAWYNLAAFYALRNDLAQSERSLRSAMAWAPSWYKPRWMLAQVLRQAGRLEEAEILSRQAADLDGGKDPEVARTYAEIQTARQK